MTQDGNKITAEEGKVFRRIADGQVYGNEMFLGYSYYINGVLQEPPHLDVPEDFEEIDDDTPITAEEALAIITGIDE